MNFDNLANIAGGIITVALAAVIVGSPLTAGIIRASGEAFSGSIRAAMGRR